MRGRRRATPFTPEQVAEYRAGRTITPAEPAPDLAGVGVDAPRPPARERDPDVPRHDDVEVPKTEAALAELITRGCARALSLSTTAKEATDAVKAAAEWFKIRYPSKDGGGEWGSAYAGRTNGHGGE